MNKSIIVTSSLNGGANDTKEVPNAIPSGESWVINSFGACDINLGDSKSSVYILRFGTDILKIISVTGSTYELGLKIEITGDGAKKVNVMRFNNSSHQKQCPFWIDAYKRN